MPVTLAPPADGEVRQRVIPGVCRFFEVRADAVEHDPDVGGGDPVLEDRTDVEVARRRSTLEGDESHSGAAADWQAAAAAAGGRGSRGTERLLLVGSTDDASLQSPVQSATLRRVELERRPRPTVVGALVDRHRVRRRRAELQTDVRNLRTTITYVMHVARTFTDHSRLSSLTHFHNKRQGRTYGCNK